MSDESDSVEFRPPSDNLVDLHISIVPMEHWVERLNYASYKVIGDTFSVGFVRVVPETPISALRIEMKEQLGKNFFPEDYVFLKHVGRCLALVRQHQERQLKVKHFLPPQSAMPEIFVLPGQPTMYTYAVLPPIQPRQRDLHKPYSDNDSILEDNQQFRTSWNGSLPNMQSHAFAEHYPPSHSLNISTQSPREQARSRKTNTALNKSFNSDSSNLPALQSRASNSLKKTKKQRRHISGKSHESAANQASRNVPHEKRGRTTPGQAFDDSHADHSSEIRELLQNKTHETSIKAPAGQRSRPGEPKSVLLEGPQKHQVRYNMPSQSSSNTSSQDFSEIVPAESLTPPSANQTSLFQTRKRKPRTLYSTPATDSHTPVASSPTNIFQTEKAKKPLTAIFPYDHAQKTDNLFSLSPHPHAASSASCSLPLFDSHGRPVSHTSSVAFSSRFLNDPSHLPSHPTNAKSTFPGTPKPLTSGAGSIVVESRRRSEIEMKPATNSTNGDSGFTERDRSESEDSNSPELRRTNEDLARFRRDSETGALSFPEPSPPSIENPLAVRTNHSLSNIVPDRTSAYKRDVKVARQVSDDDDATSQSSFSALKRRTDNRDETSGKNKNVAEESFHSASGATREGETNHAPDSRGQDAETGRDAPSEYDFYDRSVPPGERGAAKVLSNPDAQDPTRSFNEGRRATPRSSEQDLHRTRISSSSPDDLRGSRGASRAEQLRYLRANAAPSSQQPTPESRDDDQSDRSAKESPSSDVSEQEKSDGSGEGDESSEGDFEKELASLVAQQQQQKPIFSDDVAARENRVGSETNDEAHFPPQSHRSPPNKQSPVARPTNPAETPRNGEDGTDDLEKRHSISGSSSDHLARGPHAATPDGAVVIFAGNPPTPPQDRVDSETNGVRGDLRYHDDDEEDEPLDKRMSRGAPDGMPTQRKVNTGGSDKAAFKLAIGLNDPSMSSSLTSAYVQNLEVTVGTGRRQLFIKSGKIRSGISASDVEVHPVLAKTVSSTGDEVKIKSSSPNTAKAPDGINRDRNQMQKAASPDRTPRHNKVPAGRSHASGPAARGPESTGKRKISTNHHQQQQQQQQQQQPQQQPQQPVQSPPADHAEESDDTSNTVKRERLWEELMAARNSRRTAEKERQELVKRAKATTSKMNQKRISVSSTAKKALPKRESARRFPAAPGQKCPEPQCYYVFPGDILQIKRHYALVHGKKRPVRDSWKKKFFEEKKKTMPLEEICRRLQNELNSSHQRLVSAMEGGKKTESKKAPSLLPRIVNRPSIKSNSKIHVTRLQYDMDNLRRKIEDAKIKLTGEIKLRHQAEQDVKIVRQELLTKKIRAHIAYQEAIRSNRFSIKT